MKKNPGIQAAADELTKLLDCRRLLSRMTGEVKRYHCWRLNHEQTNAEHCWHVLRLYVQIFGIPGTPIVLVALAMHDVGELLSSDIQFPFKRYVPELKGFCDEAQLEIEDRMGVRGPCEMLSDMERLRLKACDYLEMYETGTREIMSGNVHTGRAVRARIGRGLSQHLAQMSYDDRAHVQHHLREVDKWLTINPEEKA